MSEELNNNSFNWKGEKPVNHSLIFEVDGFKEIFNQAEVLLFSVYMGKGPQDKFELDKGRLNVDEKLKFIEEIIVELGHKIDLNSNAMGKKTGNLEPGKKRLNACHNSESNGILMELRHRTCPSNDSGVLSINQSPKDIAPLKDQNNLRLLKQQSLLEEFQSNLVEARQLFFRLSDLSDIKLPKMVKNWFSLCSDCCDFNE